MLKNGAITEAKIIKDLGLTPKNTAYHALGLKELIAYLDGKLSLDDASDKAKIATAQYAKRQLTWFKYQFLQDKLIQPNISVFTHSGNDSSTFTNFCKEKISQIF